MLTTNELSELSGIAKTAALKAGEYIQSQFEVDHFKQQKDGGDSLASQVVTEVDLKAQEIILAHLEASTGSHDFGLLTEEATDDQSRMQKDYFWCIDPLDGTLPFTERRTGYAVSIALITKAGDPIVGAVNLPDLEECYVAHTGSGVYCNDQMMMRDQQEKDRTLHWYMDRSFLVEPYYESVTLQLQQGIKSADIDHLKVHSAFGGVRNALGVMLSSRGCYFKFPKQTKGCGSIWDYAATHLLMKELGLHISNARGASLYLNDPNTTFMNRQGILYATDRNLAQMIMEIGKELLHGRR